MLRYKAFLAESNNNPNFGVGVKGGLPKPSFYVPGLVYHVTAQKNVESIRKNGIHSQPHENREWNTAFREKDSNVYAFTHPHRAFIHAKRQHQRTGNQQSILAVKADFHHDQIHDWHVDPTADMWRLGSITRSTPVPKENIIDVYHVKHKSL